MSNVKSVNFCDICELFFDSRKELIKHTLTGKLQKRARETIMDLDEAEGASPIPPQPKGASPFASQPMIKPQPINENMERVYDPEEDDFILVPKKVLPQPTKLCQTPNCSPMLGLWSNF